MLSGSNTNRRTLRFFPFDSDSSEPVLYLRFGGRYVCSLNSDAFQHICTCGFLPDGIIRAAGSVSVMRTERNDRFAGEVIIGYGLYYVCLLSLNVIKKPIVGAGVLSEAELCIIGSVLFITYAVGKFTNGFLADRSNIRRFLTAGLLVSTLVNLVLGFRSMLRRPPECSGPDFRADERPRLVPVPARAE